MEILQLIRQWWAWADFSPIEIVAVNDFANLIIRDETNRYWRLCPEEVYCNIVADSQTEYEALITDKGFIRDWNMSAMVDKAKRRLGELDENEYYSLIIPGVAGGEYTSSNLKRAPLIDIISDAGKLGEKIKHLPDGAPIALADSE